MFIKKIKIQNYRSIINLEIKIDQNNNFISFCGANNVGKTNILNALNLFFGKEDYIQEKDCPNHKYYGTRGGSYQPKIEITFNNGKNEFQIIKDWNLTQIQRETSEVFYNISGKNDKKVLTEKESEQLINKINFFYLPSINLSFPEAIKYIMNSDIIDLEMGKTRMSGKKKDMKENIENVLSDLKDILNTLGESISPLLENYKTGWGVAFDIPTEITTFRDLMIGEIDFYIKDKSNSKAIDAKGSGLQRLCHILMYFRIISKLNDKKQSTIICIDEPDVYLHSGLQKKLLDDIKKFSEKNQLIITTHSPIFIDTIKLSNVFLLDQNVKEKEYTRGKRKSGTIKYNAVETHLVELSTESGVSTLKNYLGIEDKDQLLFDKYNIIVEGESDKIYLSKLMEHFGISVPNIIFTSGADNISKFLDFYESISDISSKPNFLVIIDNDSKGREINKKLKPESYSNITLNKLFISSYFGFNPKIDSNGNNNSNIEIEDFISPRILCYLFNKILKKKGLKTFSKKNIDSIYLKIQKNAFQNNGILALLENEKNTLNPENGDKINILNEGVKSGMAKLFEELDSEVISLIGDKDDIINKNIYNFLNNISKI